MSKRRTKKIKPVVKVHKVKLPPGEALHVEVPKDHAAVAVHHPAENVMQIVPVPKVELKKKGWWERTFG